MTLVKTGQCWPLKNGWIDSDEFLTTYFEASWVVQFVGHCDLIVCLCPFNVMLVKNGFSDPTKEQCSMGIRLMIIELRKYNEIGELFIENRTAGSQAQVSYQDVF